MRKRDIKKQVWLNEKENMTLKKKSKKAKISESEFLRRAIKNKAVKEAPDQEFYNAIKQLRMIGINLNQIARIANSLGFIDASSYEKNCNKLNQLIDDIKEKYLSDK